MWLDDVFSGYVLVVIKTDNAKMTMVTWSHGYMGTWLHGYIPA